ncbi:hypothetical protein THAOC_23935, partial [Thalassiosira oceanica]
TFNFEAKIVGDRGIDGDSGGQNRNQRTILVWNTHLRYFLGAPPANIGHRQMVQFTVLCRVGFWLARRRRPLASATLAYGGMTWQPGTGGATLTGSQKLQLQGSDLDADFDRNLLRQNRRVQSGSPQTGHNAGRRGQIA